MSLSEEARFIVDQWLYDFKRYSSTNLIDDPNYYVPRPESLITTSELEKLVIGTGEQIVQDMLTAFTAIQHEIILVTCFWAKSASQAALANALRSLSARALVEDRRFRVRICLSSLSMWQMFTQTRSLSGKEYPPSSWESVFGLPKPSELQGLDLIVRSIFVWPFSVMHSKFVIIDREKMYLPSCNISWEDWFEGCIELRGGIVDQMLLFWFKFWGRDDKLPSIDISGRSSLEQRHSFLGPFPAETAPNSIKLATARQEGFFKSSLSRLGTTLTILLPSPHHRNPSFRPLPCSSPAPAPPSPLNTFLLTIINTAKQSIYIQSPNVNSPPLLSALLAALRRGVNIRIVSNTNMMIIEQLLTAGTRTEYALRKLHRQWSHLQPPDIEASDMESAPPAPGNLDICYFAAAANSPARGTPASRAQKSHLKLTVVDDAIVVLGSGNMDRASWYTSQELGVAFFSRALAQEVLDGVRGCLDGHLRHAVSAS